MTQKDFINKLKELEKNQEKLQIVKLICDRSRELSLKNNSKITYIGLRGAKNFCDENMNTLNFAEKASEYIKYYRD